MKLLLQKIFLTAAAAVTLSALSACGKQREAESTFEKASNECLDSAAPGQFMARHFDGSVEVVRANSKEEFINNYVRPNLDSIEYTEHDFVVKVSQPVEQESLRVSANDDPPNWGVMQINADVLWQQGVRGEGVTVAIIDTGVDINHVQLRDRIAVNAGEMGTDSKGRDKSTNNVDDDGNGFVDDVNGWNFVDRSPLTGDNFHHGTHVAGIVAASHNDTTSDPDLPYVQGVAPKAKILPIAFLDRNGGGFVSDGVRGIKYAVARGAKVINASWGGDQCSRTLRDQIRSLASKKVIFVAASGNESQDVDTLPAYPASLNLPAQITVGAIGDHFNMAYYSNYGVKAVHIFAPGTRIISTMPEDTMARLTGTSMATPFVAGAVALMLSAVPTATADQIRMALYNSAGHDAVYMNASRGRLDLTNLISELNRLRQ